jgi:hypothetical protein
MLGAFANDSQPKRGHGIGSGLQAVKPSETMRASLQLIWISIHSENVAVI